MRIEIPASWPALLGADISTAPQNGDLEYTDAINDPRPVRRDLRTLHIEIDPAVPEFWIELRLHSNDKLYWCDVSVRDDGHYLIRELPLVGRGVYTSIEAISLRLSPSWLCTLEFVWPPAPAAR